MIDVEIALPIVTEIIGHDGFSITTDGDVEIADAPPGEVTKVADLAGFAEAYAAAEQALRDGDFVASIRAEVRRRIEAAASIATQLNLQRAFQAGRLPEADLALLVEGDAWIEATRAKGVALAEARDETFAEDRHWPELPDEVREFVSRY